MNECNSLTISAVDRSMEDGDEEDVTWAELQSMLLDHGDVQAAHAAPSQTHTQPQATPSHNSSALAGSGRHATPGTQRLPGKPHAT